MRVRSQTHRALGVAAFVLSLGGCAERAVAPAVRVPNAVRLAPRLTPQQLRAVRRSSSARGRSF